MNNTSGVFPVGTRVLVEPVVAERKTAGGIFIPEAVAERNDMKATKARVIAVGPVAWYDKPGGAWAKVGDLVLIAKFAGTFVKGEDDKTYRLLNDEEIGAVVTEKVEVIT